jgi:DNA-3-methyladenine glycosylase
MSGQKKLPKKFYSRNVHTVAKNLLGKYFVHKTRSGKLIGKIVEVEAYDGTIDEAAHSFKGKTKRTEIMFAGGGLLYVYFTYGMYFCSNVVTGNVNEGKAVLLRGIEPVDGFDIMIMNRYNKKEISQKEFYNLTNGPGKICQSFALGKNENGTGLCGNQIYFLNTPKIPESKIVVTKRIGINKSVDLPWRYYIKDNPFVSKK